MMSWIVDHLPWWAYWLATIFAALATLPMWWPIATWLWALLPNWARLLIVGALAVLTAYAAGRNRGSANERARAREAGVKAEQRREEKHNEIEALPDADLDRRLNRWLRKP